MQTKMVWPSYEHIARVAYRIYLERGAASGPERADWLRAEQLLLEHLNKDDNSAAAGQTVRSSEQPERK